MTKAQSFAGKLTRYCTKERCTPTLSKALELALVNNPDSHVLGGVWGRIIFSENRFDEARAVLTPLQNNSEAHLVLYHLDTRDGNSDDAYLHIEQAIRLNNRNGEYYYYYGIELLDRIELRQGRISFGLTSKLSPGSWQSEAGQGHINLVLRNNQGAIQRYTNAFKIGIPSADSAHIYFALGEAHTHEREFAAAIMAWKKAVALAPENLEYASELEKLKEYEKIDKQFLHPEPETETPQESLDESR